MPFFCHFSRPLSDFMRVAGIFTCLEKKTRLNALFCRLIHCIASCLLKILRLRPVGHKREYYLLQPILSGSFGIVETNVNNLQRYIEVRIIIIRYFCRKFNLITIK